LSLAIRNSSELISKGHMKLKVLLIGDPGTGKSSWVATAPKVGVAACETGWGSGMLSAAFRNVDFCEPNSVAEMEAFAKGQVFPNHESLGIDSLTAMNGTFIKDYALAMPRRGVDSPKRRAGVPELDDYGTMAETTRKILAQTLDQDKHVLATATSRTEKDDNGVAIKVGPQLAGQMFLGAPAMFDFVFHFKMRKKLRQAGVKASEYTEYYFLTQNDGLHIAKCRASDNGDALLPPEIVYDLKSGRGCFPDVLEQIEAAYARLSTKPVV
jgi:hypothetical protein